jgi:hypothetical protein|tara:strand:- start:867 stop:1280 length:414 start_codon:yes stop_codon:yes gene_type:complete
MRQKINFKKYRRNNMSDIRCINFGYVVPEDKADEVQSVFNKHSAWMDDFYCESVNGQEHLISSYFTRAPEFINPVDPSEGVTGNVIFTLNERFTSMESIQRHAENAQKNDYFPQFGEILGTYGAAISMGGEIYHSIR